jgi:LEA14-like dessication related protein
MYRKTAVFFLVWTAMSILSCASLRQELIRKPDLGFEQMELRDSSLFEATAVFKFKIGNSNPMGLNIRNIAYHLNISDKKFIKGISDKDLRIRAAGIGVLELPIMINYADLSEFSENTAGSNMAEYDLFGTIEVGPFTIPYRTRGVLSLPKPPKLSLKTIRVTEMTDAYAAVILEIEMENSNSFAIPVKRMEYSMFLAGKEFTSGSGDHISVPPHTKVSMDMPIKIDFVQNGNSFAAILNESSGVYEISVNMAFDDSRDGERTIPFRKAGSVPVVKTDQIR